MMRKRLFALVLAALGACTAPSVQRAEAPDLPQTWNRATIVLPPLGTGAALVTTVDSPAMQERMRRVPANAKLPVVLYVHGCTGMGGLALLQALAEAGFVVVAPDSFARRYRALCVVCFAWGEITAPMRLSCRPACSAPTTRPKSLGPSSLARWPSA